MPNRRSTRVYRKLLELAPRIMITDAWQVIVATLWLGLGLATLVAMLFPGVNSVVDRTLYTTAIRLLWSFTLIGGAACQLVALQFRKQPWAPRLERLGISLCILGVVVYALALLASGSPAGIILFVVFGIAVVGMGGVLLLGVIARRLGGL